MTHEKLAGRIAGHRARLGMGVDDLAAATHLSVERIASLERDSSTISTWEIIDLAAAFDVYCTDLTEGTLQERMTVIVCPKVPSPQTDPEQLAEQAAWYLDGQDHVTLWDVGASL